MNQFVAIHTYSGEQNFGTSGHMFQSELSLAELQEKDAGTLAREIGFSYNARLGDTLTVVPVFNRPIITIQG